MDSTSRSFPDRSMRVPSLIALQAQVFEHGETKATTEVKSTVSRYSYKDGKVTVHFLKRKPEELPTNKSFFTTVFCPQRMTTCYFGYLMIGYLVKGSGEKVHVLIQNSPWFETFTKKVIVSKIHNAVNNSASTVILSFLNAREAAHFFCAVTTDHICIPLTFFQFFICISFASRRPYRFPLV